MYSLDLSYMEQYVFFCYDIHPWCIFFFFFLNDPATTEISPLSLPDALPISSILPPAASITARAPLVTATPLSVTALASAPESTTLARSVPGGTTPAFSSACRTTSPPSTDRKSTRLNSSHGYISYAVFCLKKK